MAAPRLTRGSNRPLSPLSLAIATALCMGAAPLMAGQSVDAAQAAALSVESAFRAADRAALYGTANRALAAAQTQTTSSASGATSAAAAAPSKGAYHLATGGRTDDLEVAAESWRADAEFKGDWGLKAIGAEYAYARGFTGAGVALGVYDSGVLDTHSEFAGDGKLTLLNTRAKIGLPADEQPGEYGKFDGRPLIGFTGYSDHGTHVAGTIAANRNGSGMHGVAFGASLHSATHLLASDIFTEVRGQGRMNPTVASIDAFVASGARFVNHSWGISNDRLLHTAPPADVEARLRPNWGDAVVDAFRRAVDAGMVQVFSAGNTGSAAANGTGPHASTYGSAPMFFPELEKHWLVVTNMTEKQETNTGSYFCGNAQYWCVTAPGTGINSSAIAQSLGDVDEKTRLAEAASTVPFKRRELLNEIIALQNYVGEQGGLYIALRSQSADSAAMTALVNGVLARAARVAGKLQRYDMSEEPDGNRQAMTTYRDDPTVFLGRAMTNITTVFARNRLVPTRAIPDDVAVAFQVAVTAARAQFTQAPSYSLKTGTSMAAPYVTGTLGVIAERFGYLTNGQVRDVLLTTAGDRSQPLNKESGWGLISLKTAVNGPGAFLGNFDVTLPEGVTDTWSNDITNALVRTARDTDRGSLLKRGGGSLTLSGTNRFDGFKVHDGLLSLTGLNAYGAGHDGIVDGGALALSGTLQGNALRVTRGLADVSAAGRLDGTNLYVGGGNGAALALIDGLQTGGYTRVGEGGRLGGIGTLGDTTVASGGTIAPGRSIGTLTVNGNYVQQAGSRFEVEMTPPDQVDRLAVTGRATLEGGTVVAERGPGVYALGERYDFLTAAGGITGRFGALDSTAITPFLGLSLSYDAFGIGLDVARGASFASLGSTYNQRATGASLDAIADSHALINPLVQLFPAQAFDAIDLLSGDVHATAQSVLIDSSRHVRGSALDRAAGGSDPLQTQRDPERRFGAWVDLQRTGGSLADGTNAAGSVYSGGNTLIGADYTFDNGLRVGVLGGVGESDLKAAQRLHARTDVDTRHAGVYAGYSWRGLGLRGGWIHGSHDIKVDRRVVFSGITDSLSAHYDATTKQAFVEAGYRFGNARWGVEPYAQFAQVRASAEGFTEDGGAAALRGRTRDVRADLTTGGLRFDVNLRGSEQAQTWLGLRGGVGYRKTGGELVPWTDAALAGGERFIVQGAPVGSDAKLLELGVAARTSPNSLLEVGYHGQYADEARDHGANLRWSVQF